MNVAVNQLICERCQRHNLAWLTVSLPPRVRMFGLRQLLDASAEGASTFGLIGCPVVFFPGVPQLGWCSMLYMGDPVPAWCPYFADHKYEVG